MNASETAIIDSTEKASRFLGGLAAAVGFDEAIRRVELRSSREVGNELRGLARWVRGESSEAPVPALGLIAAVVKDAPPGADLSRAIAAAETARSDARALADHVRGGLMYGVNYLALLLLVAGIVAVTWLTEIAPMFRSLYGSMSADLPGLSAALVRYPWAVVLAIAALGLGLAALVLASRRLALAIESMAALGRGILAAIPGARLSRAHDRWRVLILARAWAAGGEGPRQAVRRAADSLAVDDGLSRELEAEMELASDLDSARAELEHLSVTSLSGYRNAIEIRRAVGLRFLQIAVAILVGIIVIAIYLPIFGMGAIV